MLSGLSSQGASRTSRGGLAPSTTQRCSSRPFTTRRVRLATRAAAASSSNVPAEADVVVVGAGLAGLNAAAVLRKHGLAPVILEAGDAVGGRTRTDNVDGFLLDRGFQIFLTGYPEARETLDYEALQLQPFYAGARVWYNGQFHTVADPLRHFVDGLLSLSNPIGSVGDKVNVGLFRLKTLLGPLDAIFEKPETTILERLRAEGFSEAIIDRFFRPFLGGIFFNTQLTTSSRLFEFVMRMLATGQNCLPAAGIGAMAQQLAARLPADSIYTSARVQQVSGAAGGRRARVQLADGRSVTAAKGVVVAVEGPEAWRLLAGALDAAPSKSEPGVGTCNLYFRAPQPPAPDNVLYLNGTGSGLVNNCCFPSTVAPSYAPAGQTLVSVSTIGTQPDLSEQQLVDAVKQELSPWFGPQQVSTWSHLRTYRIPFAQPNQNPPTNFSRPVSLGAGLYVCGDHRDSATFDAALKSGRRAAEALIQEQGGAGVAAAGGSRAVAQASV
ncbi:hypothetical protein COO60DRAFT_1272702 [Scenedesmus sp. NREL 46B-D3]|nr:hypothetical protein COO60DRAFT_1272702 [Scenedesmus sp. NREL 46B-D3]